MHCETHNATFFMMNKHNIAGGIWLIDSEYAQGYLPLVTNYLKGNNRNLAKTLTSPDELTDRNSVQLLIPTAGVYEISEYAERRRPETAPQNSIAVIDIADVITKYDQDCGPAGMVTKSAILKRCYATNNIDAIVLRIDSGGGEGYAMFHMIEAISERNKPVYAFVSDFACSAAYGIASACDSIYVNMDLAKVGSIGAYTTLLDYKKYFERQGVKIHEIYAAQSRDKNIEFKETVKGNYEPLRAMLSVFTQKFIDNVAENRKSKLSADSKKWNTGKTMYANEAMTIGLVDKISTWAGMIADIETNITNNNSKPMNTQPLNLNAVLNVESLESTTDGVYLNEVQIATIDAELASRETAVTNANNERAAAIAAQQKAEQDLAAAVTAQQTAEQSLATAQEQATTDLTAKDEKIAELNAQIATLQGTAGGSSRRIVTSTDNNAGGNHGEMQEFFESIGNARQLFDSLPE